MDIPLTCAKQQNRTHGTDKTRNTKHEEREIERKDRELMKRAMTTPCDFLPMGKSYFSKCPWTYQFFKNFHRCKKFPQTRVPSHGQILYHCSKSSNRTLSEQRNSITDDRSMMTVHNLIYTSYFSAFRIKSVRLLLSVLTFFTLKMILFLHRFPVINHSYYFFV